MEFPVGFLLLLLAGNAFGGPFSANYKRGLVAFFDEGRVEREVTSGKVRITLDTGNMIK